MKTKEQIKAYNEKDKWKRIKQRYGLSKEDYFKLLDKQNGVCAICKVKKEGTLHIDHNHKTGVVRGLLCSNCNMDLGIMKDNIYSLDNAIEYLKYDIQ